MHLICGEALYDVFIERTAVDRAGEISLKAVAGGSPFNVAIGMARLEASAAFGSDLARDVLGEGLVERLCTEGVDDRFLRRSAANTPLAFVSIDRAGSPSYRFQALEGASFCPDREVVEQFLADITGLHLGSIALILPRSAEALFAFARQMSDRALVSLDPNIRLSVEPDRSKWRKAIERVRPFAHLVKVSEEDLVAIYGSAADVDSLCKTWLSDRTELVALTRGASGATFFSRTAGRVDIPALPTKVADTVGAGDSFMAAMLAALSRAGRLTPDSIAAQCSVQLHALGRFAAAAAALTCSMRGPVLPRLAQVERLAAT